MAGVNHLDKDIAGEFLPLHYLSLAVFFDDVILDGDLHLEDVVLQTVVFNHIVQVSFHHRLITGVGVDDVPLRLFFVFHSAPLKR